MPNVERLIENLSIWFQGGVRRWVIIFSGVCLLLLAPFYFLASFISSLWFVTPFNPWKYNDTQLVTKKLIPERQIDISETQVVLLKDGSKELYLSLNNKDNPEIGYSPYVYDLSVLDDKGSVIDQQQRQSYLLPGDIRYVVYRSNDNQASKLVLKKNSKSVPVYYNPNSDRYKKPNLEILNKNFSIRTFTDQLTLTFTIKNNEKKKINVIDIIFTIRDARDSVVGIGDMIINDLDAQSQKDISITYTQPLERQPKLVDIVWSVNYLNTSLFESK
jgi:hypothetical protein